MSATVVIILVDVVIGATMILHRSRCTSLFWHASLLRHEPFEGKLSSCKPKLLLRSLLKYWVEVLLVVDDDREPCIGKVVGSNLN